MLEAALALVVGLVVGAALAAVVMHGRGGSGAALRAEAERELATARREADAVRKEAEVAAKEYMLGARTEVEEQLKGRSLEVARSEERLGARASQLDQLAADIAAREGRLGERNAELAERETHVSQLAEQGERELERVAAMSQAQARETLLANVEEQARHDVARRIRTIEEEARHESDRRVRNIISIGIQRTASAHAASTTVSSVQLPLPGSRQSAWPPCRNIAVSIEARVRNDGSMKTMARTFFVIPPSMSPRLQRFASASK